MKTSILIIEDELKIARFLELELTHEGYRVMMASGGAEGLELSLREPFGLILLDIMLPELNGLEVLRRLRRESDIPVILLTARDELTDKVMGLDLGADDYITKPFRIEELLARIRVVLRRQACEEHVQTLNLGELTLDSLRHSVTRSGKDIDLTKREFDLLEYLMRNKGIVLSRSQLIEQVWGYDFEGDSNVVDVYIRYLRAKVDTAKIKYIHTVRGVGYCLQEESK